MWLTHMPYLFDGNNLIGKSAAALRSDRHTRQEFLEFLSGAHTARGGRFEVFFDGDDPDRPGNPRGVRVHYSAPVSTDDAILRKIEDSRTPAEITVVTNDGRLRSRCRDAGARTMSWDDFSSSIRYRRDPERGAPEVNVKEWARYFGVEDDLDKESNS